IDVHTQYKKLKMSAGKLDRTKPDEATLAQALTDLGRSVRRVLDRQQLTEPIAAVLRGGYIVADADDDSQGKYARNDFPAVNTASIRVEFETKHFRDDESKLDYSLGGRFEISTQLSVV